MTEVMSAEEIHVYVCGSVCKGVGGCEAGRLWPKKSSFLLPYEIRVHFICGQDLCGCVFSVLNAHPNWGFPETTRK